MLVDDVELLEVEVEEVLVDDVELEVVKLLELEVELDVLLDDTTTKVLRMRLPLR